MLQFKRLARQIDARLVWFCGALLSVDAFFIAVFAVHRIYTVLYDGNTRMLGYEWHIGRDRSYAEMFGYLKIAIIILLLISFQREWKRPIYLALIPIFTFVFLDDAFQVHERLGLAIADALALQPFAGLRARDFGELIVWTAFAVPLFAVALAAFVRSPQADRSNGVLLISAFAVLVLFAVVADMAHVLVRGTFRGTDLLFTVIEDGGEQITLTLTCGIAVLIRRELRSREPR
jgi:hypothetical protein